MSVRPAGLAAIAVALLLSACVTPSGSGMGEPAIPGQIGQVSVGGAQQNGILITVHAPAAQSCTLNNRTPWRGRNGHFDFLFQPNGAFDNSGATRTVRLNCRTPQGEALTRYFEMPMDMDGWRVERTQTTVATTLLAGIPGLVAGPAMAEMNRERHRYPPILIHVPTPAELATPEARDMSRQEAVRRWGALQRQVTEACAHSGYARSPRSRMVYACRESFFTIMRDVDLSVFSSNRSQPARNE